MDLLRIAARVAAKVDPRVIQLWHQHVEECGREEEQRLDVQNFMEIVEEKGLDPSGFQIVDLLKNIPPGYSLEEEQRGEYYVNAPEGKGPTDDEETDAFTRLEGKY